MIGQGQRSKVYENLENSSTVIKETINPTEKKVADYFFSNPSELFVKIHSIEKVGRKYIMVVDKVENPDFKFNKIGGNYFTESKFQSWTLMNVIYSNGQHSIDDYIKGIENIVIDSEKHLVKPYYEFLLKAREIGMDIFDTAWNMGFKNGKFICFDTTM